MARALLHDRGNRTARGCGGGLALDGPFVHLILAIALWAGCSQRPLALDEEPRCEWPPSELRGQLYPYTPHFLGVQLLPEGFDRYVGEHKGTIEMWSVDFVPRFEVSGVVERVVEGELRDNGAWYARTEVPHGDWEVIATTHENGVGCAPETRGVYMITLFK